METYNFPTHPEMTSKDVVEFCGKIKRPLNILGCWEWTGKKMSNGYGRFHNWNGAHRLSHELFIGPIPDKIFVCHKCDNKSCVNPNHFFLGDMKANVRDRSNKGKAGNRYNHQKRKSPLMRRLATQYTIKLLRDGADL